PAREVLQACCERHLVHVSLGVESGDPSIREGYGKTWSDDELRAIVSELKARDIRVSVLTLVGAGGIRRVDGHVKHTAELLASLKLGRGDTVFLLDEEELIDPARRSDVAGRPVGAGLAREQQALKQALSPLRGLGAKVLPYSLNKQWA